MKQHPERSKTERLRKYQNFEILFELLVLTLPETEQTAMGVLLFFPLNPVCLCHL